MADTTISDLSPLTVAAGLLLPVSNGSATGRITVANINSLAPVQSVAERTGAVVLTKTDVGLGNVTNDAQLKIASNLSDLNSVATARSNLGLATVTGDYMFVATASQASWNFNAGAKITAFDTIVESINKGTDYDVTNKRYVVPVAGVYQFNIKITAGTVFSAFKFYLYKNSANYRTILANTGMSTGECQQFSTICKLAANDVIELYADIGGGGLRGGVSNSEFSGIFLTT